MMRERNTLGVAIRWLAATFLAGTAVSAAYSQTQPLPQASVGPPNFAKLPDIGGALRIGLSADGTRAAMLQMHPGHTVVPGPYGTLLNLTGRGGQVAGLRGQFRTDAGGNQMDQTFAVYTMPPGKQQAFAVSRVHPYAAPGIDKVSLVRALRAKYGPETKANRPGNSDSPMPGDQNILAMFWVYDEQGHPMPPDRSSGNLAQPYGCPDWGIAVGGPNVWIDAADQYRLNQLPAAGFCDSVVIVTVRLGPGPTVASTSTEIDDRALLRRAVIAAGNAASAASRAERQRQLDRSKQAKPSL